MPPKKSRTTSIATQNDLSATTELPEDTPAWGKSVFHMLNNSINSLDEKIKQLIIDLKTVSAKADEAHAIAESNRNNIESLTTNVASLSETVNSNKTTIDQLTSKVTYLSEALEFVLSDNRKRDEQILNNETYSRRDNLIFRGFVVGRNDRETPEMKVRSILSTMQITDNIPFVRCHYLYGNKQIIVRFQWYSDREKIWKNRYKLKGSNFYVAEDYPPAIDHQRKQMFPVFNAAKQLPEYNRKVTMRGNKLILNGETFTCSTINRVPNSIHPAKLAVRSNTDVLVFGGSTSAHHGLSNFYEESFVYEHIAYNTAEQAYQHKKARCAGDQNMQREIMFHPDAATQRHLGQRIQGLDDAKWNAEKRGHMKDILLAKFSQIANLKKLLIDTGNKSLAEANARDNYFGIGLPLTHKDVLDPRKWHKDGNQLGTILMEIRQELM